MEKPGDSSDSGLMDLLRHKQAMGVSELARAMQVTATAVRQRLNRLMGHGLVEREVTKAARGRPGHRYSLTEKGRRKTGSNFTDLALALWREVRGIRDPEIRTGLLQRLASTMAGMYAGQVRGSNKTERMESVSRLMNERNVPFVVETVNELPVLTALACPYPELAEQDRSICSVEKLLFSELLDERVRLTECRLDGSNCCRFQTN